jgi:hypothetical protein
MRSAYPAAPPSSSKNSKALQSLEVNAQTISAKKK